MTHPIANEMIAQQRGAELRKEAAAYRRAKVARQRNRSARGRKSGLRLAVRQSRHA